MSLTEAQIAGAAAELFAAEQQRRRLDHLDPGHRPTTVEDGYRIQAVGHERRGRSVAGGLRGPWKVGATSLLAQAALGVDAPFVGRPATDRIVSSGDRLILDDWFVGPPVLEVEFGLRPTVDLVEMPDDPLDLADVVEVVACIELVNARYHDMGSVGAPSLVADNAVASAIVVGPMLALDDRDIRALDTMPVSLTIDGVVVAEGVGADALGHPLHVLHFAATLARAGGDRIEAGELVITGTCTGVVDGAPGMDIAARHGGVETTVGLR